MSKEEKNKIPVLKIIPALIWIAIIILLIVYRNKISVDSIRKILPKDLLLSFVIMLLIFGFKSITIIIYSGLLYTASGILFSLPAALLLNFLGSIVMCTIPYLMAYPKGYVVVNKLNEKYPKFSEIVSLRGDNDFIYTFLVRLNKLLPFDIVSSYLGAQRIGYLTFILGSLSELSFSIVLFTLAGTSLMNKNTTFTIFSLVFQVFLTICSFFFLSRYHKKNNEKNNDKNE